MYKAQNGRRTYTTGDQVTYGTPEYREAYNRGEVVTKEGTRSPILLDEVNIRYNRPPKGIMEQYKDKIIEENRGAGVLGAIVGTPISAIASIPQLLAMKIITGKMQRPSEAMDIQDPYGAMAVNTALDPLTAVGAGAGVRSLVRNRALAKAPSVENGVYTSSIKAGAPEIPTIQEQVIFPAPVADMKLPLPFTKTMSELTQKIQASNTSKVRGLIGEDTAWKQYSRTRPRPSTGQADVAIEQPYISRRVISPSREQEVFENSLDDYGKARELTKRTVHYDSNGNAMSAPEDFEKYTPFEDPFKRRKLGGSLYYK